MFRENICIIVRKKAARIKLIFRQQIIFQASNHVLANYTKMVALLSRDNQRRQFFIIFICSQIKICNYIYLKQSENKMFWNFCIASGYLGLPIFTPQVPVEQKPKPVKIQHDIVNTEDRLLLNLTVQDHLKAGYQNNKKLWNEYQDEKLKQLREKQNLEWEQIAEQLPGRNAKMCYSRYKRLQFKSRDHWKIDEDQKLKKLAIDFNFEWDVIAKQFPNRTVKQVKEHYINYLRPQITKDQWGIKEDTILVQLLNQFGKNWKAIEQRMPGRTQNQIKNRYFGRLRKLQQKKDNRQQKIASTCTSL